MQFIYAKCRYIIVIICCMDMEKHMQEQTIWFVL